MCPFSALAAEDMSLDSGQDVRGAYMLTRSRGTVAVCSSPFCRGRPRVPVCTLDAAASPPWRGFGSLPGVGNSWYRPRRRGALTAAW